MHLHILGICGTFMGGLAAIAKAMGHKVTGSDANVYPPMSTQLEAQGIELIEGFDPAQLSPAPDLVIIGNAMVRGNPCVEYVLDRNITYMSGPQWLSEYVLAHRWVLAVSGTHGKTSTASMLAWILEDAGLEPGYLIGGIPQNFDVSARLGNAPFFVIEADEYDSAFFDKRAKFVHYRPRTLVLNNLEYDHADIYPNLEAIKTQFHHLMRILPGNGLALAPRQDANLMDTLDRGCWTPVQYLGDEWLTANANSDASAFDIVHDGVTLGRVEWSLIGQHNMHNAVMAVAAARHAGVPTDIAIAALAKFKNAKRRMEVRGVVQDVTLYDDFAHHPTAIKTTLAGLRAKVGKGRILAVLEPRSATMKQGVHKDTLAAAWQDADLAFVYEPENLGWSMHDLVGQSEVPAVIHNDIGALQADILKHCEPGDHILIMSNGGFGGIHSSLLEQLQNHAF